MLEMSSVDGQEAEPIDYAIQCPGCDAVLDFRTYTAKAFEYGPGRAYLLCTECRRHVFDFNSVMDKLMILADEIGLQAVEAMVRMRAAEGKFYAKCRELGIQTADDPVFGSGLEGATP